MALRILRTSSVFRPYAFVRPLHAARVCYHPQKDSSSTKGDDVFVAAAFPDDFGDTPLIQKHRIAKVWEEMEATTSEASVKADRGEIQFPPSISREEQEKILRRASMDPKLDEM